MSESNIQPRRSLIFTPGNKPEMYPKALVAGADIVCVDIEDGVAPEHKADARARTLSLFGEPAPADGVERMVRVNSLRSPDGLADILALLEIGAPPPALMLPKVKSPEEVRMLDELLIGPCAHVRFHIIIETNEGLHAAFEIARASSRIDSLLFGAVDMAAELRVEVAWEPLLYTRSRLVHAAAGAGVDLIDVPFLDLRDAAALEREARASAALGFTGKAAIHPKQISVINDVFSPDADQVAEARRIISAFDASDGGLVVMDGKLIEKPVLRSMHRIVAIADHIVRAGPN